MSTRRTARVYVLSMISAVGVATVLAVVALLVETTPAQAGLVKPPYCSDRCSSWRPCTKLCRLEDESLTTCGDYGVCNFPPDPVFVPEEPAPTPTPVPTPTPLPACFNNLPRCSPPTGGPVCPSIPGIKITANPVDVLTLHLEASPSTLDPALVTWTFGDGAPASTGALVVDHTYTAGTFTVTLQVNEATCGTDVIRSVPLTVPFVVDLAPIP